MNDTEPQFPQIVKRSVYMGMSPREQEEYAERKIGEIIKINPQGISVPAIDNDKKTPFSRPTIIKHLERMVSGREAYKIKHPNITIYYPNGKPVHDTAQIVRSSDSGTTFRITHLNNNMGEFFYIEDLSTRSISGGSILVRREDLHFFKKVVEEAVQKEGNINAQR